jgi:hypothetical protein
VGLMRGKPGRPRAADRSRILFSLQFSVPLAIGEMRDMPADGLAGLAGPYAGMSAGEWSAALALAQENPEFYGYLVTGLAALAYRPGGIHFAGQHWRA